jgi:hypothetical protein
MTEEARTDPRVPVGYVLHAPRLGSEVYGPFVTEDEAWQWASRNAPERVMLAVLPIYDTIRA